MASLEPQRPSSQKGFWSAKTLFSVLRESCARLYRALGVSKTGLFSPKNSSVKRASEKSLVLMAANAFSVYRFRLGLLKRLSQHGYRVYVICPPGPFFHNLQEKLHDFKGVLVSLPIQNTSLNIFKDLIWLFHFWKFLKTHTPEVMLLFHIKPVLLGSLMGFLFPRIRCVSTFTGLGHVYIAKTLKARGLRMLVNKVLKIALKRNFKVAFQNPHDQRYFTRNGLISSSRCFQMPGSGIDLCAFPYAPLPSIFSFVFVGRLIQEKGIVEYLEASALLKKKYPSVIFRVVGGASTNPSALPLSYIQDQCSCHDLVFEGEVEHIQTILEHSTVFVLPSYREGTPRAGLEALATGRPVITTDAPGCRELIGKEGHNGVLIPKRNVQALVEAMERLIGFPAQTLETMGSYSRQRAENFFDVEKVNASFIREIGLAS